MAAIKNLNGLSAEQVNREIRRGGRFVMYQYTMSLVLVTLQRSSDIYFIPTHEKSFAKGLPFTLVTLALGWWGLPWGPVQSVRSIACNLSGGRDVTQEVMGLMDSFGDATSVTRQVA